MGLTWDDVLAKVREVREPCEDYDPVTDETRRLAVEFIGAIRVTQVRGPDRSLASADGEWAFYWNGADSYVDTEVGEADGEGCIATVVTSSTSATGSYEVRGFDSIGSVVVATVEAVEKLDGIESKEDER